MKQKVNLKEISAVNGMVDIIKEIVKDEINKQDNTILCRIAKVNGNGSYDVFIEPDDQNVITNIPSIVDFNLQQNDYVYVYKIRNQLNNSFIIKKIGDLATPLANEIKDIENTLKSLDYTVNNMEGNESGLNISPFYIKKKKEGNEEYLAIGVLGEQ